MQQPKVPKKYLFCYRTYDNLDGSRMNKNLYIKKSLSTCAVFSKVAQVLKQV